MPWHHACLALEPNFSLQVEENPIAVADDPEIAAIWAAECKGKPILFNGTLFSALTYDAQGIKGRWISYRDALAANRNPELAKRLGLLPVAVSGMVWAGQHLLFGQRAHHLAHFPGYLELPPSGGLDHLDYQQVILNELKEETGIAINAVAHIRPLCILHTQEALEICLEIRLHDPTPPVLSPTIEYLQFFWVAQEGISAFLAESLLPLVPTSAHLLTKTW